MLERIPRAASINTVKAIGDNAPRFLQPFAGAADFPKVGNDPLQGWRVDRALSLIRSLFKQRKDNTPGKLFLLKKFLEARRCVPRIACKQLTGGCGGGILHARKLVARVVQRPGKLQLEISRKDRVSDRPGDVAEPSGPRTGGNDATIS